MNTKNTLISVVIPTRNSCLHLERCLASFLQNSYPYFEIIVVDNYSLDSTASLIKKYESLLPLSFHLCGPERHKQRPYGAKQATGDIVLFLDSDMCISPDLLLDITMCLETHDAVIIPEEPIGANNYWTKVKKIERSLYKGDDLVEAARAFTSSCYASVGGFDDTLVSMEDWALTHLCRLHNKHICRTKSVLFHDEGYVVLSDLFRKKKYYGGKSSDFTTRYGFWFAVRRIYFFRSSFWRALPQLFLNNFRLFMGLWILLIGSLLFGIWGWCTSRFSSS